MTDLQRFILYRNARVLALNSEDRFTRGQVIRRSVYSCIPCKRDFKKWREALAHAESDHPKNAK